MNVLIKNIQWIFSGIGVFIISVIVLTYHNQDSTQDKKDREVPHQTSIIIINPPTELEPDKTTNDLPISKNQPTTNNEQVTKDEQDYTEENNNTTINNDQLVDNNATYQYNQENIKATIDQLIDINWRPINYIYNTLIDNKDGTITDKTTGLIWQQDGSKERISFEEAQEYIRQLNAEFTDIDNWRLPTLKELISLVELDMNAEGVYIDPLFNSEQRWCWTSDQHLSSGFFWVISFNIGNIHLSNILQNYFVRGVRDSNDSNYD